MLSVEKVALGASRGICWVSALGLSVMMLLTSLDVVLRYFGHPIKGSYDVVGLSGAFVLALPIAYTQLMRGHVGIDFIVLRFSSGAQKIIDIMNCLLNIGVYSLLTWQCALYGKKLFLVGRVSETIKIPLFPFPYVVAAGFALMSLVLLIELYKLVVQAEVK
ncbi:MAG: TRAP transporter small permease [Proteobacteria bacterium]|nr:TRAP transporter small permease [Pseudomonadota bacterium]